MAIRRLASAIPREFRIDPANGQLPYTTTNKWHAVMSFLPKPRNVPRYHYPIILTSVFVFTMYFAVIREKNEYDLIFEGKLKAPMPPKETHSIQGK